MQGDLLSWCLFVVVSSVTPGPNNLMLLQGGIKKGFWGCKWHILGIELGCFMMVYLSYLGIASLMVIYPLFMPVIKILGSCYLLWLTYAIWINGITPDQEKIQKKATNKWSVGLPLNVYQAMVFQWLNPKAWIMVTALPSIAIISGDNLYKDNLPLCILFLCINIFCITVWAAGGSAIQRLIHHRLLMRVIHKVILLAIIYCIFAMWF